MEDEELFKILLAWNPWYHELDYGIERTYYVEQLLKFMRSNAILTITGVRRSGKSFIIRNIIRRLIENGIGKQKILYVNFDEHRLGRPSLELLERIYVLYRSRINPKEKGFLFLDEIHKITGWERFVRGLHERGDAKFVVSGSTSSLLSEEYGTLLTGRHLDLKVFPLSFKEFLIFRKIVPPSTREEFLAREEEMLFYLQDYLKTGGFPEVVLAPPEIGKRLLETYFRDIITRDIANRYGVKKSIAVLDIAQHLATSMAALHSFNSIANAYELSPDTVRRFFSYFENAGLFSFAEKFSYSLAKKKGSLKKAYIVDTGMAEAVGFNFSENTGRFMENAVHTELLRKEYEISYWRDETGKEIDFVAKKGKIINALIQVAYSLKDKNVKKRELGAFRIASEKMKCERKLIITWNERSKTEDIRLIPLAEWLLFEA
ncbi:MAG: ATP-binding protein [Candidatus Micrarchaeota archaeon]